MDAGVDVSWEGFGGAGLDTSVREKIQKGQMGHWHHRPHLLVPLG